VFIGIAEDDTMEILNHFVDKLVKLRIFEDADGKTNLSLGDVDGALLLVSQFTLYADCRKGNRPSFVKAGAPEMAAAMYEAFIARCRERVPVVQTGRFGADMKVELENDGPFTIIFDSREM
jgi:D-tyrosyl-tRNA(Tyr) deacylase